MENPCARVLSPSRLISKPSICHQNSGQRRNCFNFAKVTQKISVFTEQRDGSFVRLSVEGERKSCEPAVRRNIRRNTFRIVLEGDVVKRSANNARETFVWAKASRHRIAFSWRPLLRRPPSATSPRDACSLSLDCLPPCPATRKGHQRKTWTPMFCLRRHLICAKSRPFPNDNVYQQLRWQTVSTEGSAQIDLEVSAWYRLNSFR